MDVPSYQQLLAEQYEENARNLLVHQQDYEEDDVDEHEDHDYSNRELEDKEAFNKFAPRHEEKDISKPANPFEDKSKISIRYDKDVKTHVLNIDSKFRSYTNSTATNTYVEAVSSHFIFRPHRAYKNTASIKLSSLEFPNVSYTFSVARQNISIQIASPAGGAYTTFSISPGNYSTASDLATAVEDVIQATYPTFSISYDSVKNKITISNSTAFDMKFSPSPTTPFDNGLGYYLGYRNLEYTNSSSYVAEALPDIYGDTYAYLVVNDYGVIEHQDFNQTSFSALAKIQLNVTKGSMIFDQLNTTTKEYFFVQPTNISQFDIRLLDAYGRELDLQGMNFSITLEIKEILNIGLYEKLRDI